jgi:hypothetical protein
MFDVHISLAETQWEAITTGQILGPGKVRWSRRSSKTKRAACQQRIAEGAPLVLYYFAGGQLDWFDGSDAEQHWVIVRTAVTPAPRLRGDLEWTGSIWVDDANHSLVLLTGHC